MLSNAQCAIPLHLFRGRQGNDRGKLRKYQVAAHHRLMEQQHQCNMHIDSCSGRYVEEEGPSYPDCGNILEKFSVNICDNKERL